MKNWTKKNLNLFRAGIGLTTCFLLIGCGNSSSSNNQISINVSDFNLVYNGNVKLEKIPLRTDDSDEIIDLYQETGDNTSFKDSLLIAKKYAQGLGINAFTQDNLDTLISQGLTLSNVTKTQISLKSNQNAVLAEYEITEGFISDIPLLYVSQLFIPEGESVILLSFITENASSHTDASNMFKNIK